MLNSLVLFNISEVPWIPCQNVEQWMGRLLLYCCRSILPCSPLGAPLSAPARPWATLGLPWSAQGFPGAAGILPRTLRFLTFSPGTPPGAPGRSGCWQQPEVAPRQRGALNPPALGLFKGLCNFLFNILFNIFVQHFVQHFVQRMLNRSMLNKTLNNLCNPRLPRRGKFRVPPGLDIPNVFIHSAVPVAQGEFQNIKFS